MKTATALLLFALSLSALADSGGMGRVSFVEGEVVVLRDGGASAPAMVNEVIGGGDSIRSAEAARAEIQIGSLILHLGADSRLYFSEIGDEGVRAYLVGGTVAVRVVENPYESQSSENPLEFKLSGPGFTASLPSPGRYILRVEETAELTVREGEAVVERGPGQTLKVVSNQSARMGREETALVDAKSRDAFEDWAEARATTEKPALAFRDSPEDFTGYENLDEYGDWQETSAYGTVWIPYASYTGWEPYRYGHWSFLPPRGYIWVDYTPWGFAPFHYGRWAHWNNVWCWVPGPRVKWSRDARVKWPHHRPNGVHVKAPHWRPPHAKPPHAKAPHWKPPHAKPPHAKAPHWKPPHAPHWRKGPFPQDAGGVAINKRGHGLSQAPDAKSAPLKGTGLIRQRERIVVPAARMQSHRLPASPARSIQSVPAAKAKASGGVGLNRMR